MKFALKRQEEGTAVVVPILLRPVEFAGLPFAEIQALPGSGQFIGGETRDTPNRRDELFASAAKDIREAIHALRTSDYRFLRAAQARNGCCSGDFSMRRWRKEIPKGERREVAALISIDGSDGPRFLLAPAARFNPTAFQQTSAHKQCIEPETAVEG